MKGVYCRLGLLAPETDFGCGRCRFMAQSFCCLRLGRFHVGSQSSSAGSVPQMNEFVYLEGSGVALNLCRVHWVFLGLRASACHLEKALPACVEADHNLFQLLVRGQG